MEYNITKNTLCQELVFKMISYIEDGDLRPGDCLPSVIELAHLFGVGRNSMREALTALSAMGYVAPLVGVGTIVSSPSFENLAQPFVCLLTQKTICADDLASTATLLGAACKEHPDNSVLAILQQLCLTLATDRDMTAGNRLVASLQSEQK